VPQKVNAIVIADVDIISQTFFMLREQGFANLQFDNVSFVLNCMDELVDDPSFIELRKKRIRHRTLEKVEEQTRQFVERRLSDEQQAEEQAKNAMAEAQGRLEKWRRYAPERTSTNKPQIMAEPAGSRKPSLWSKSQTSSLRRKRRPGRRRIWIVDSQHPNPHQNAFGGAAADSVLIIVTPPSNADDANKKGR
jgi:hypothetical protein